MEDDTCAICGGPPDHVHDELAELTRVAPEPLTLARPCGAPAPLVANGGAFVGCVLKDGHLGDHSVTIGWR